MKFSKLVLIIVIILSVLTACSNQTVNTVSPSDNTVFSKVESVEAESVFSDVSTVSQSEEAVSSDDVSGGSNSESSKTAKKTFSSPAASHGTVSEPRKEVSTQSPVASSKADYITVGVSVTGEENEIILPSCRVKLESDSTTVFDATRSALKNAGIVFDYSGGRLTAYVEGIDGLYAEGMSGWLYEVNGSFDKCNKGCGQYKLCDGDTVRWVYTRDGGKDVGADYIS